MWCSVQVPGCPDVCDLSIETQPNRPTLPCNSFQLGSHRLELLGSVFTNTSFWGDSSDNYL